MPVINLNTNIDIDESRQAEVLGALSAHVADMLGKPERYVMVLINGSRPMLFGGSDAPLAYIELKSLGLAENQSGEYSASLCQKVGELLGIDQDRIYIEFTSPERHLFGWDGRTF